MDTILDVAGSPTGGHGRWRREAYRWSEGHRGTVRLIGLEKTVSASWLVRRERLCRRARRIAANNVSFVGGTGPRVVLLVNALHFLRPGEAEGLPPIPRSIRSQRPVVAGAARRADIIVTPCTDMAERVATCAPYLADRIQVRAHPITRGRARIYSVDSPYVLFPAIPAPHKDLTGNLARLLAAIASAGADLAVYVTAPAQALGRLRSHPHVRALGEQSLDQMDELWAGATAVFAPTTVEAFGYPVAEGRAIGVPVVAPDTPQNREIGGDALVGFDLGNPKSLTSSVDRALNLRLEPDPAPFDAEKYFSWLTAL